MFNAEKSIFKIIIGNLFVLAFKAGVGLGFIFGVFKILEYFEVI